MAALLKRLGVAGVALWLGAAFAAGPGASPDPATLRVPPEDTARARTLVRLLGSEVFRERDGATRELAGMGRRALAALEEARLDPDPEVSARVGQLYPRATLDEMSARVASFLADPEGRYDHDIPAWPRFRAALGDGPAGRELFSELVADRANHDLLVQLGGAPAALTPGLVALAGGPAALRVEAGPPDGLRRALAARRQQFLAAMNPSALQRGAGVVSKPPSPAEFALLLLAESAAPDAEPVVNGTQFVTSQYFYSQGVQAMLAGGQKHSATLRTLVRQWLDTRPGPNGAALAVTLATNLRFDPDTIAAYGARALRLPAPNAYQRVPAITAVGQSKGLEHLGVLTTAFTDERTFINQAGMGGFDVRVCDFALAMALSMTGQQPQDYGMGVQAVPTAGTQRPTSTKYYFKSDGKQTAGQKSQAAFARWRAYEASLIGGVLGGPLADRVTTARHPDRVAKPDPKPVVLPDD